MTRTSTTLIRLSIAAIVGGAALLWSGQLPLDSQSSLVSSAEARIGRPLTPMSYAGVARRTTRRAVAVGAVSRCCCLCGARGGRACARMRAGRGCLWTDRHRLPVTLPRSRRGAGNCAPASDNPPSR